MATLNKVFLIGNLTRDPELRYTPDGTPVTEINLAVTQRFVDRDGTRRDEPVFVRVTVWRKQAEACGEFLSKGASVFVEGRLHLDRWESKEGESRSRLRVVAQRVQFLTRPRRGDRIVSEPLPEEGADSEVDTPVEEITVEGFDEAVDNAGPDKEVPF